MTINDIAKKTLAYFKNKSYIFTPDEYMEVFCREAKKNNVRINDCEKIPFYIQKLDKSYQNILRNYRVNTIDELITFLITNLNRNSKKIEVKDDKNEILSKNLLNYSRRLLQALTLIDFNDSRKIFDSHLDVLKKEKFSEINDLSKEVTDFLVKFDDTIIKKIKSKCKINSDDIIVIFEKVYECLNSSSNLEGIDEIILKLLTPSIATDKLTNDIVELKKQLKHNPDVLTSKSFADEIEFLFKKRVKADRNAIKENIDNVDEILNRLLLKIARTLEDNNGHSSIIKNLYIEISKIDIESDFDVIKTKLLNITDSINKNLVNFSESIKKENDEVAKLKAKIHKLEQELQEVKEESRIDFLTKLLNKRALIDTLIKMDSFFNRHKENYSIVFADIDFFKKINDTYGHDAGDIILKSIATVFRRYSRDIDMIGRYGGEEFVFVLPKTDKNGAYIFADKIRQIIEKTKFMYKSKRIDVTISAGVSERTEVNSYEELLKLADDRLYQAKESGRNKVVK